MHGAGKELLSSAAPCFNFLRHYLSNELGAWWMITFPCPAMLGLFQLLSVVHCFLATWMPIFSKQHLLNIDLHTRKKKKKMQKGEMHAPKLLLQLFTSSSRLVFDILSISKILPITNSMDTLQGKLTGKQWKIPLLLQFLRRIWDGKPRKSSSLNSTGKGTAETPKT